MMAKRYRASVERDGRFWLIQVPGVGATQARHLRELDEMTRDLIATMVAGNAKVDVEYDYVLPDDVRHHLARADQLRAESAEANSAAAAELRAAARSLADSGMPLRDVGQVLGVSHQRAHQLVKAS